jgi:hypothetical protein
MDAFFSVPEIQTKGWVCVQRRASKGLDTLVGTGRLELPTPRTPSEWSTRLSHVLTR